MLTSIKSEPRADAIAYSVSEACLLTNTGRTSLYKAIKEGELRALKRGWRTIILADDLRRWIGNLPPVAPTPSKTEGGEGDGR